MAWTTPATFTTGNVLTAAQLNTNLRDNSNYLFDQPMALLSKTANASIANITSINPSYDVTLFSSPGITVTAGSAKFLPTFSGTYQVWANHVWGGHAAGVVESGIFDSNQFVHAAYDIQTASSNRNSVSIAGVTGVLNGSTNFVQLYVAQNSGSSQNILGGGGTTGDTLIGLFVPFYFGIKMLGTGS